MANDTTKTEIRYDIDESHGCPSGTQTQLYLIPAAESEHGHIEICLVRIAGAGMPGEAYHGRWFPLGTPGTEYVGSALIDRLRQHEDLWRQIDAAYLGAEWDGSNHRGKWSDHEELDYAVHSLDLQVECYWNADDWLQDGYRDLDDFNASIDTLAQNEVDNAKGDAVLDADDVKAFLRDRLEELIRDADDNVGPAKLDRCRKLLDE